MKFFHVDMKFFACQHASLFLMIDAQAAEHAGAERAQQVGDGLPDALLLKSAPARPPTHRSYPTCCAVMIFSKNAMPASATQ